MNIWAFTGNLGRDAEQRHTPGGDAVASFSVAVKSGYGKSEGTVWANCNLWGKRSDSLMPYLKKGTQVGVTGEVNMREWKDKEGMTQKSLDVRVNDLTLLGGKKEAEEPARRESKPRREEPDDDLPF